MFRDITKTGEDNPNFETDDMKKTYKPSESSGLQSEAEEPQKLPRKIYLGIMFVMVIIATVVISANGEEGICGSFNLICMCYSRQDVRHPGGASLQRLPTAILLHAAAALPQ